MTGKQESRTGGKTAGETGENDKGETMETTIKPGDKVTCKIAEEAYYSNYAGRPRTVFNPGDIGTVACIAPKVRITSGISKDKKDTFLVVDYTDAYGMMHRVGLNHINAVKM